MSVDITALIEGLRNYPFFDISTHIISKRVASWAVNRRQLISSLISCAEIKNLNSTDKKLSNLRDIIRLPPKKEDYETDEEYLKALTDYEALIRTFNIFSNEHLYINPIDLEAITRLTKELDFTLNLASAIGGAKLERLLTHKISTVKKITPLTKLMGDGA